jgi:8-oxo-dGTP pyrophosphatase MutT (NUDIX family)
MAQKYFVFTENKCLVFLSYQQDWEQSDWKKKDLKAEKIWQLIHSQTNEQFDLGIPFEVFCSAFKRVVAAGGIVCSGNNLLMIFRNNQWDLPKGWMESGEFPMQTALREVREECGQLDLTVKAEVPLITYHVYPAKGKFILKETHWYRMHAASNYQLTPQRNEGISKVEFVPFEKVSERLENSYRMIRWIWESFQRQNEFIG